MEPTLKKLSNITEDGVPVNNAGQGKVAGIGVGPSGEPAGRRSLLNRVRNMLKRKVPNVGSASTS